MLQQVTALHTDPVTSQVPGTPLEITEHHLLAAEISEVSVSQKSRAAFPPLPQKEAFAKRTIKTTANASPRCYTPSLSVKHHQKINAFLQVFTEV